MFYVSPFREKAAAFAPVVRADGRTATSVIMYDYVSHRVGGKASCGYVIINQRP